MSKSSNFWKKNGKQACPLQLTLVNERRNRTKNKVIYYTLILTPYLLPIILEAASAY